MSRIFALCYLIVAISVLSVISCSQENPVVGSGHEYNSSYTGEYLNRIAFPIGGIGAGMFCIEGTGAISHMSVRNRPEVFKEPCMFAAISLKGIKNGSLVIEGYVPEWKKFGRPDSGNGSGGTSWGLPRFESAVFTARFPFAVINLSDPNLPLEVRINGWSPFIPTDADNSSLPVGGIEYTFTNTGKSAIEALFSYNSVNFMGQQNGKTLIRPLSNGFILSETGVNEKPETKGDFAIFTNETGTVVDHCWFRGGWWDPLTITWNSILKTESRSTPPVDNPAPGASLYVPFTLEPGETREIRLMMAWYVPDTNLQYGIDSAEPEQEECDNSD